MVAQSKKELVDVTRKEFEKLSKLLGSIDERTALAKDEDDTSIKDVIGHRAHWIDLFLGWHADGLAGKTVHFPAQGYKWSDIKRYNAELRTRQSDLSWADAVAMLKARYEKLVTFIESRSNVDLYGGPMKGANNNWTSGRWAEAAGPSHFRSASKYVRAMMRNAAKAK
ncbi:MAG: ClbS/DfsB family four-helix bundle protein [Pseudomonadota bacterium]